MTWHASPDVLSRLVVDPGTVDEPVASSVEAHLALCAECRLALADALTAREPDMVTRGWDAVADRIDRPRPSLGERLLCRLGLRADIARLVASTPALRFAWFAAVAVVAAAAVWASRVNGADGPFLVIAPLAPLAAVAATFASAADPAGEAGVAGPLHGAALMLRRAATVLASTFAVLVLAALALPQFGPAAAAWVLPGLALALAALAVGTRLRVEVSAGLLAAVWLAVVGAAAYVEAGIPVADLQLFDTAGQLTAVVVAIIAAAVLARRRDVYATLEVGR